MSLHQQAQTIQQQGRGPDTMLVHMAPSEVAGLQALAEQFGGTLTTNPTTGLPEAGFLEDILPMVVGAATMFIPGMQGVGAYMLAGGMGGLTGLATRQSGESGLGAAFRGMLGGVGGLGMGSAAAGLMGSAATAGTGAAGAAASGTGLTAGGSGLGLTAGGSGLGLTASATGAPGYALTAAAEPSLWASAKPWLDKGMSVYGQAQKMGLMGGEEPPPQFLPPAAAPAYTPARADLIDAGGGSGFTPRWAAGQSMPAPGAAREDGRRAPAGFTQGRRFDAFPAARFAGGGQVRGMESGGFVVPADVVSALGNGSTDAGLRALSQLGAEPIRGQGDGQSDDIPANIDGAQPARVADGEAYLAPSKVAQLGNGDPANGAKRLYDMLARVRQHAHGHVEQQRPVDPSVVLA
jgi:hypothetical protein